VRRWNVFLARVQPLIAAVQTLELNAAPTSNETVPEAKLAEALSPENGPAEAIPAAELSGVGRGANPGAGA